MAGKSPNPPGWVYDPQPYVKRLKQLLKDHNETYREASLRAGLDEQSVHRHLVQGKRPSREACIAMADHFGINPNELIELAGYKPLEFFKVQVASAEALPPEAVAVAMDVARIPDPGTRKMVSDALRVLLKKYFEE